MAAAKLLGNLPHGSHKFDIRVGWIVVQRNESVIFSWDSSTLAHGGHVRDVRNKSSLEKRNQFVRKEASSAVL